MLNPPTGVTLADYIAASKAGNESHIRITFLEQNIVLEDGDIEQSGININDLLNGDTNLTIGKAVSKEITVPILNSSKVDNLVWSSDFKLEYGLKISGTTKWITIGCFTGVRPDKLTNVEIIDFTALDYMQKFDVLADDWLDSLTYPMTVLQMFQSLCTFCGVGYAAGDELANIKARSFSEAPIVQKGLICRNILSAIAEACGCYARINADGNCQMVWFSDHTSDYTLTADEEFPPVIIGDNHVEPKKWSELESYTWEDLESMTWGELCGDSIIKIESVNVKHTEDDIGVYYPSQTTKNTYYIIDNPFLVTANQTEVTNYIAPLYTRLSSLIHYLPVSLSAIGCMLLEAGDIINITAYNQVLQMPVFCKATNWNGGLTDRIECTGEANNNEIPRNIRGKLSEGGRYHIFRNDLNELYSELYDGNTGDITLLHQQANQIEAYAEKKARVYYSATAPSGTQSDPLETGDLWIDTANANQLKRYNGSSWADASFDDPDKYTVRSGIDITANGVEVTGGKYVKIISGGTFDVDSTNFKIDSVHQIITNGLATIENSSITFDNGRNESINSHLVICSDTEISNHYKAYGNIIISPVATAGKLQLLFASRNGAEIKEISLEKQSSSYGTPDPFLTVSNWATLQSNVSSSSRFIYLVYGTKTSPALATHIRYVRSAKVSDYGDTYVGERSEPFTYGYFTSLTYTNIYQNSSKEVKHDIKPLMSVGDKLDKLEPVTFIYNDDKSERTRAGLIYEDTVEVMPEICTDDESNKAINYVELIPMLLKEIQELRSRVKALEKGRR